MAEIEQFISELVHQRILLERKVPLCKECTNPRGQADSRLVATIAQNEAIGPVHLIARTHLRGKLGIDVRAPGKQDRGIMVRVLVCMGETQYARQVIRPDYQD